MGPITYALCKKPVIGLVLFASSACAFPPLFHDEALPLQQAQAGFVKEFRAPVSKTYFLELRFHFPTAQAKDDDMVVGSRHEVDCKRDGAEQAGAGRPIPIHVLVREKRSGTLMLDKVVDTLCISDGTSLVKQRRAARLELARGDYIAEIRNLESQSGLDGVRTTVSLFSGMRK
ncbi:DUF5625 family protein [Massilia sp. IC2-477]|uniref:DUF5625 family protein n=1 Tax=Massilia sp. IC2-477 TaxID=2887198 RepID=UPI001D122599|nr:DUF5625 family protein [Massilia sp. IC2-477]MCC2957845.1 DUF5625 family protein [Massilia sp. IC2-477]